MGGDWGTLGFGLKYTDVWGRVLGREGRSRVHVRMNDHVRRLHGLGGVATGRLTRRVSISPSFVSTVRRGSAGLSLGALGRVYRMLKIALTRFFGARVDPIRGGLATRVGGVPRRGGCRLLTFLANLVS